MTLHQTVLTTLEKRALRYQNSKSYEVLEEERLLDEAIDKMGTVPCTNIWGDKESRINVEEQLIKEIRKCQTISSRYMGYHQVGRERG